MRAESEEPSLNLDNPYRLDDSLADSASAATKEKEAYVTSSKAAE